MNVNIPTPTKSAFKATEAKDYVNQFKAARAEAQEVDGTYADLDNRDGFVKLSENATVPGAFVQIWGPEKQNAKVMLNERSYKESLGEGNTSSLSVEKARHIELASVGKEAITASDSFSQTINRSEELEHGGSRDRDVWSSNDQRYLLIGLDDSSVISESYQDTKLLESLGGNIADYQTAKAELEA